MYVLQAAPTLQSYAKAFITAIGFGTAAAAAECLRSIILLKKSSTRIVLRNVRFYTSTAVIVLLSFPPSAPAALSLNLSRNVMVPTNDVNLLVCVCVISICNRHLHAVNNDGCWLGCCVLFDRVQTLKAQFVHEGKSGEGIFNLEHKQYVFVCSGKNIMFLHIT